MKPTLKEAITYAALAIALFAVGGFICWLASEICKPI
jgi:hypothetical protein